MYCNAQEHRPEHSKRVDIVNFKIVSLIKEGSIKYRERVINSPQKCADFIREYINDSDREMFVVMALDVKNQPTAIHTVSIGSLNASIVHPREVFKFAIFSNASAIIIAHNHPSGNSCPSEDDKMVTERLKEVGQILGINVLDHIIIGDGYYSFKEMELIL